MDGDGALTVEESTELSTLQAEMADARGAHFDGHWSDHYWHREDKQRRHGELLAKQERKPTAPVAPTPNAPRKAEIQAKMQDGSYWHDPAAQEEYLRLLQAEQPNAAVAETLGISEEAAADMAERVSAAFAGVDTHDMDFAFEGLSDNLQRAWFAAAAEPDRLDEILETLTEEEVLEARRFRESLTPEELRGVKRCVLL